ncbi:TPA: hypothetical protein TUL08_001811 [Streptococcus equi subsp. zooepidemicus]|uniref:hypothetical protein n=1 Tax=Streptococcus equi TaxID=1336 RepID=UPI000F707229|nr:hypothetical protein [Streptococcus equi]VED85942.1 Uncharacterised protein [Streptococcus equi subsp. equi]MCD3401312.1 hypothetical protein [Streptococcus equi subsp. zooepidemicus]MCD3412603.1 hypothetical protein [Streptococcus equi subsp. zooepidemicus]MCD3430623.1 hypothetical protein [Streptococcus equi subsp. zooepidemicus]QGM23869.1 hypothetical protein GJS33_06930 [Streptococcus equi subsp. zooepidemicus]
MDNIIFFKLENSGLVSVFVNNMPIEKCTYYKVLSIARRLYGDIIIKYPKCYSIIRDNLSLFLFNDFFIKFRKQIIWEPYEHNFDIDFSVFKNGFLCFYTGIYPIEKKYNGVIHLSIDNFTNVDLDYLLLNSNVNSSSITDNASTFCNFGLVNVVQLTDQIQIWDKSSSIELDSFPINYHKFKSYKNTNIKVYDGSEVLVDILTFHERYEFLEMLFQFYLTGEILVKFIIPYYKNENFIVVNNESFIDITRLSISNTKDLIDWDLFNYLNYRKQAGRFAFKNGDLNNRMLQFEDFNRSNGDKNENELTNRNKHILDSWKIKNLLKSLMISLLIKKEISIMDKVYVDPKNFTEQSYRRYIVFYINRVRYVVDRVNLKYYISS